MDFLKRWISPDVLNERVAKHQCALCGWPVPAGKGQDPAPLTTMQGAVACRWCAEHTVLTAQQQINTILNAALHISGEEARKQLQAKQGMND
jgi:hypothetical protein